MSSNRRSRPMFTTGSSSRSRRSTSAHSGRSSDGGESEYAGSPAKGRELDLEAALPPPAHLEPHQLVTLLESPSMEPTEGDALLSSYDGKSSGYGSLAPGGSRLARRDSVPGQQQVYRVGPPTSNNGAHYLKLNSSAIDLRRNQSVFQLSGLIDNKGGEYESFRKTDEELKAIKKKSVRRFYERQNEVLDMFVEVDEVLESTRVIAKASADEGAQGPIQPTKREENMAAQEAAHLRITLAININFLVNIALLAGKVVAIVLSNSISLIASAVDSLMDFVSTLIIFFSNRMAATGTAQSRFEYPVGRRRMEPLGILIFAIVMITSFAQVLIESVTRLLSKDLEMARLPLSGIIVMAITVGVKGLVWMGCKSIKNSSVEALVQDAENDIVFNFFSLLFPLIGQAIGVKQLDPLGGALLSLYIIVEWIGTLIENVAKLTGKRASPAEHQRVAYMVSRFSPLIKAVQHLQVYYVGDGLMVEVDIVLPAETALQTAHNLGETLQVGIELLEGVERCFVHLDVSVNPLSGHINR